MATTEQIYVKNLSIDLNNFRTTSQKNELDAIKAMITISPGYFWGLMESLLDDGYLPTENIIVIAGKSGEIHVKEGNRRIAALKIILGIIDINNINLPQKIINRIKGLEQEWIKNNQLVPCTIYQENEIAIVDKIVTIIHGRGQKAGRDIWETVARSRHNKIINNASEPALDLLEKFLEDCPIISAEQKTRWAGTYPLSILDEAIKKIAPQIGVASSPELAKKYPNIDFKKSIDEIIYSIGMGILKFPTIRRSPDFAVKFGIPAEAGSDQRPPTAQKNNNEKNEKNENNNYQSNTNGDKQQNFETDNTSEKSNEDDSNKTKSKPFTTPLNDERTVKRLLKGLKLYGTERAKVETLRIEMTKLKLEINPIAFCFLLRSIFEISAKIYCQEKAHQPNAPTMTKQGKDKSLAEALRGICEYLTQNNSDKEMLKKLHGALTELAEPNSLLSVTSLNQLVHNPNFTVAPQAIATRFTNIFPLLELINK